MLIFEGIIKKLALILNWAAKIAMVGMMLVVTANVVLGYIGYYIFGTYEIASFLTAFVISFALGYCTLQGGHVNVSFLLERFPEKTQKMVDIITGLLSIVISFLLCWVAASYATEMWGHGEVSGTLRLPLHPIAYGISAGLFLQGLAFIVLLFYKFYPNHDNQNKSKEV